MQNTSSAVKLDKSLLEQLREFCEAMGYKQGAFVEKAIRLQMEREELKEDIFDLVSLKPMEALAKPFRDYDQTRK